MAVHSSHCRAWFCPSQRGLSRCPVPPLWMAPTLFASTCVCGKNFSIEHALSCTRGGLPSIRHNELRDITAQFLTEICHNVGTEPTLQPLADERMRYRTANKEDGARLDIVADSFWERYRQRAFFDIRVFNPFAQSYRNTHLAQCHQ